MNGNISYNKEGAFKRVNQTGKKNWLLSSFRKLISSIKLVIRTKAKKIDETKNIFFRNFFIRYNLCIWIFIFYLF